MKKVLGFKQDKNGRPCRAFETAPSTTTSDSSVTPITPITSTASIPVMSREPSTSGPGPVHSLPRAPVCTPEFFNTLIKASHDWRLYDIRRIVSDLKIGHLQLRYNGELMDIGKLLDRIHQYGFATMVHNVSWRGGPDCRVNLRSNLAHWLLDNIMWEVRIKSRYTDTQITQKILSII